jgi:hypothetical protein
VIIDNGLISNVMVYGDLLRHPRGRRKKDPLTGINVEVEYELIKKKKSNLPSRIRSLIIQEVEGEKNE